MTAPRLRIAMSIHFNHSNNRLDNTVNYLGMHASQHGDECSVLLRKRTPPNHFRLQDQERQVDPACPALKLSGLKLKTRDPIADITLNKEGAVSTGKRVFKGLAHHEATGREPN